MNIVINQFKCAFFGHEASFDDVIRMNKKQFKHNIKELDTLCIRCCYPIKLRKSRYKPHRYQLIEED